MGSKLMRWLSPWALIKLLVLFLLGKLNLGFLIKVWLKLFPQQIAKFWKLPKLKKINVLLSKEPLILLENLLQVHQKYSLIHKLTISNIRLKINYFKSYFIWLLETIIDSIALLTFRLLIKKLLVAYFSVLVKKLWSREKRFMKEMEGLLFKEIGLLMVQENRYIWAWLWLVL